MKATNALAAPVQREAAAWLPSAPLAARPAAGPLQQMLNASPKMVAQCQKVNLVSTAAQAPAQLARTKVSLHSSAGRHARRVFRSYQEQKFKQTRRRTPLGRNIGTVKLERKGPKEASAPAKIIYVTTTSMKLMSKAHQFPWDTSKTATGHRRRRAHTESFLYHALQVGGKHKGQKIDFSKYRLVRLFSTNALCSHTNSKHNEDCEHTMKPLFKALNPNVDIEYCTEYQTGAKATEEFPAVNSKRETARRRRKPGKPKPKNFEDSDSESEDEGDKDKALSFEFSPKLTNLSSPVTLTKL